MLAVLATIGLSASASHDRMMLDRVDKLGAVAQSTLAVARSLEAEVTAGRTTREAALGRMRGVVKAIRFDGGSGYMVIIDNDGRYIAKGDNPTAAGTISDSKDENGRPTIELMGEALRDADEGTIRYLYGKPGVSRKFLMSRG